MPAQILLIIVAVVSIDCLIMVIWRHLRRSAHRKIETPVTFLGAPSPLLSTFKSQQQRFGAGQPSFRVLTFESQSSLAEAEVSPVRSVIPAPSVLGTEKARPAWHWPNLRHPGFFSWAAKIRQMMVDRIIAIPWSYLGELTILFLWAVWIARDLLIFSPYAVINGGEFANLIQTHFIWTNLSRCGWCFLWNGFINGGAPAFAELTGAILHPLVFIPVLIWGVVDGAKVTVILSLALAGWAQWGLAAKLRLGWGARLWSGMLMTAGGHLVSKLQNGNLALVLGQACAALVLMFGVDLFFNRNRKSLVGFAISLALLALSGEGYIQIGVILGVLPILALLAVMHPSSRYAAWKDFALAGIVAVLLCGVFLVPLGHLLPVIGKDGDLGLGNFQPLEYLPLNLVIRDLAFHNIHILGKDPYLYTHMIYIGWVPLILAILSLKVLPRAYDRLQFALWTGVLLVFLVTSRDLPLLLQADFPLVDQLRHLPVASGLAVPYLLTLAALSAEHLYRKIHPRLSFHWSEQTTLQIFLPRLVLVPAMILALVPVHNLSKEFFGTHTIFPLKKEVQYLKTESAQWVTPPTGAYDWTIQALSEGLKINTWRPWFWKQHQRPLAQVEAFYSFELDPEIRADQTSEDFSYVRTVGNEYALLNGADFNNLPCQAISQGGWIDVSCPAGHPDGTLTIQENAWSGWQVWVDGVRMPLVQGPQWLTVDAPEGTRQFTFRYLPWDVPLGALLTLSGIVLAVVLHFRIRREEAGKISEPDRQPVDAEAQ